MGVHIGKRTDLSYLLTDSSLLSGRTET
jgi:hypothetical protein